MESITINGKSYTFAEIEKALQMYNKEKERCRIKRNKAYWKNKDVPEHEEAIVPEHEETTVPEHEEAIVPEHEEAIVPEHEDTTVPEHRTDHRGRIFHTSDEQGRITSVNGQAWVPISIPKITIITPKN
jgi:hypothetical protein